MDVLSSRVLLHPTDFERSYGFYAHTVGLHPYREFGSGDSRGVVFFTGGGFLELSGGSGGGEVSDHLALWWQVRDVDAEYERLAAAGVELFEAPIDKPWGLREARVLDPDRLVLVLVEVPDHHPLRRDTR